MQLKHFIPIIALLLTLPACRHGTHWEHQAADVAIAAIDQGIANTDEFARIAIDANEAELFALLSGAQSDLDAWLERHPSATPEQIRQWMAETVMLQSATLSNRLAAAERLRDQRDVAADNLRAARQIIARMQSINDAQMAFQEAFKVAASRVQEATTEAIARRAAQKEQERSERQARRDELRANIIAEIQRFTGRPAPASQPGGSP